MKRLTWALSGAALLTATLGAAPAALAARLSAPSGALATSASVAQPKPSPDEFEPVTDVPPEEQIPAIGLVAAAYGFVWVALLAYVWSLGRRLQAVEREIAALEQKRP